MIKRLKQIFNIQNECHSEQVAETHKSIEEKSNFLSFRTCFGIAMLFLGDHASLKRVQGDNMLKAFTLAEVLVVIGIIGVVSALTIPNLQQGTNSQEVITKVTKARATIDEAYGRAIATYGDPCLWVQGQTTAADQAAVWYSRIIENLKVDKDCGLVANTNTTCWYDSKGSFDANYYKARLSDGTSIALSANTGSIATGYGCGNTYAFFAYIDIDGPNKGLGADCDDIYSLGFNASGYVYAASRTGSLGKQGISCAYWVLDKGNADFLKASNVSNTFKCSNGKYLDWSNNTTCN